MIDLRKLAKETGDQLRQRVSSLQDEQSELQAQLRAVEAELHSARLAPQRILNFQASINGQFQCPVCWVRDGVHSDLRPIAGTDKIDRFRCVTGNETFEFDA